MMITRILFVLLTLSSFLVRGADQTYPPKTLSLSGQAITLSLVVYDPPFIADKGKITNRPLNDKIMTWLPTWNKTNEFALDVSFAEFTSYFTPAWFAEQQLTEAQYSANNDFKRNLKRPIAYATDTMVYQCIASKGSTSICILGHILGDSAKFNPENPVAMNLYQFDPNSHRWLCTGITENKWLTEVHPSYLASLLSFYQNGRVTMPKSPAAVPQSQ
jgi:hypothetical protein